jgi:hypothetical protein
MFNWTTYDFANYLAELKEKHGDDFCIDLAMEDVACYLPSSWGNKRDRFIAELNHILTGTGIEV